MSKARSPRRAAVDARHDRGAGEQRDDADGGDARQLLRASAAVMRARGAGDGVGERAGDDRRRQQRELGEEAVAARAGQAQQRDGQQVPPAATRAAMAATTTPAATNAAGALSGQRAGTYSSSGRSQGIRQWFAM